MPKKYYHKDIDFNINDLSMEMGKSSSKVMKYKFSGSNSAPRSAVLNDLVNVNKSLAA